MGTLPSPVPQAQLWLGGEQCIQGSEYCDNPDGRFFWNGIIANVTMNGMTLTSPSTTTMYPIVNGSTTSTTTNASAAVATTTEVTTSTTTESTSTTTESTSTTTESTTTESRLFEQFHQKAALQGA